MSCLFCQNFQAIEPAEHKAHRESNTCGYRCGREWDNHTAGFYIRRHREYLSGYCRLYPEPLTVRCNHVCGQIKLVDYVAGTWPRQPGRSESLVEWSATLMQKHIDGDRKDQEIEYLEKDVARLKKELKASRERSASRLKRLEEVKKLEAPKKDNVIPLVQAAE